MYRTEKLGKLKLKPGLLYSLTTNSMKENRPWETNSRSADQETSCLLRNQKALYRVHKNQPMDHIFSHTKPVALFWTP